MKAIACEFLQCIIAKRTDRFYFSLNGINYLQTKMKRKANLDTLFIFMKFQSERRKYKHRGTQVGPT